MNTSPKLSQSETELPVWLVRNEKGMYLERKPFDGSWSYEASCVRHATPLTETMARYFAEFYKGTMVRDTFYVTRKPYRPGFNSSGQPEIA